MPRLHTARSGMPDRRLKETAIYLHLSRRHLHAAVNPLDQISFCDFSKRAEPPSEARSNPNRFLRQICPAILRESGPADDYIRVTFIPSAIGVAALIAVLAAAARPVSWKCAAAHRRSERRDRCPAFHKRHRTQPSLSREWQQRNKACTQMLHAQAPAPVAREVMDASRRSYLREDKAAH